MHRNVPPKLGSDHFLLIKFVAHLHIFSFSAYFENLARSGLKTYQVVVSECGEHLLLSPNRFSYPYAKHISIPKTHVPKQLDVLK